jgi:hypothetical protein
MHHHHSNPVMFDLQATWCKKLLDGEKKVELRRYPIDPTYLGMPHLLYPCPTSSPTEVSPPPYHTPSTPGQGWVHNMNLA